MVFSTLDIMKKMGGNMPRRCAICPGSCMALGAPSEQGQGRQGALRCKSSRWAAVGSGLAGSSPGACLPAHLGRDRAGKSEMQVMVPAHSEKRGHQLWSLGSRSDQIRSVTQSCPTLCDSMNRSTPGLPVHHQLPEFTQTHVHRVSDAIQPSHPLSSPSPPVPNPSQHQSLFQ